MKQYELIEAALKKRASYVIKNANVVNVFTGEILRSDVAMADDIIIGVGEYSAKNEYDADGAYLCPGFIDAHVHIESSMVVPQSFARTVIPHGTTTVIADPHEIANVCGIAGIKAMYKMSDDLPLLVLFMLPSCVPSTPFEHSGAELFAEDMEHYSKKGRVLGLAEVMDYASTIHGAKDMLDKLRMFENRPVDGHAPLLSGDELNAYRIAGPGSDHECSNYDEILEKLRTGMKIVLRIGSAANNMQEIFSRIAEAGLPTDNMMFCTDDKHLEDLRREGSINCIARMAVEAGIPPVTAVCMASYNAARAYGVRKLGAIAPGYRANMVLFNDLKDFTARQVFIDGKPYADTELPIPLLPSQVYNSVHIKPVTEADLHLKVAGEEPVIELIPGQLVTKLSRCRPLSENGLFVSGNGLNKLAVIERHHATGSMGLGIVEGFGLTGGGAIASTVAHDSHNLVVVGDNDADMLIAIDSLSECGGGYCVVSHGIVIARLPLPIAGLMTDAPIEDVLARQQALLSAAASIGVSPQSDPLVLLSFLALPVIPEVRLTDKGLFNVLKMDFVR